MKIAIPKERRAGEARVAASPDTVKRYKALGYAVTVETGAGLGAAVTDQAFAAAGAEIAPDYASAVADADVVLKVRAPLIAADAAGADEVAPLKRGAVLIAILDPWRIPLTLEALAAAGVVAFAMDFVPRITRAQAMDVLSSQSNLAGYRAVIDAAAVYQRAFPMMMTAAGTVAPARVCVMGAGVAGLQAIATARRMGAVVSAFDVRRAAKEQVESLGAAFIEVDPGADAETKGGYAKEMDDAYKQRQSDKIHETLKKQDIVICTALIPGKPAPVLVTEAMVKDMKPGSVIVDLAVEQGGNCPLSRPGEIVEVNGVKLVGWTNVAGRVAADASALYAKNLLNFLTLISAKSGGALAIDWNDEIVTGMVATRDGAIVHPALKPAASAA